MAAPMVSRWACTGVIGFMGIKNIISALAGVKYVMPLSYEVNTIPNFPHVYDVRMSLVDFDIFQQQRETISSKQQKDMIEIFGTKRNPFLRIKQLWGAFNAYPDFPLSVKDSNGEVVGCLDPDYYFRSFEMFDDDIIEHLAPQQEKMKSFTVKPKELNTQSTDERQKNTNKILNNIKTYAEESYISINMRSAGAFGPENHLHGELTKAKNINTVECKNLIKPTWRFNQDWL
jgi:hypothetical protein